MNEISNSLTLMQKRLRDLTVEISRYRSRIRQLDNQILICRRSGDSEQSVKLTTQRQQFLRELDLLEGRRSGLANGISDLQRNNQSDAVDLDVIAKSDDQIPFFLMPVRLETKFKNLESNAPELWIRVFPDRIAIDTHEHGLTPDEVKLGRRYHERAENSDDHEKLMSAWIDLIEAFGEHRAAYIAHNPGLFLEDPIPERPGSWSEAPRAPLMPDYFVFRLYQYGEEDETTHHLWSNRSGVVNHIGNNIPQPLIVGPKPPATEEDEVPDEEDPLKIFLDPDSEWMGDFDRAIEFGMGIKIILDNPEEGDWSQGFSRVVALGIKDPALQSGTDQVDQLETLFKAHRYSNGISLLPLGTPTNSSTESGSGYNSKEDHYAESYAREIDFQSEEDLEPETIEYDGDILLSALGMNSEANTRLKLDGRWDMSQWDAHNMAVALWQATWGSYLSVDFWGKGLDETTVAMIQDHFTKFVRARGPLSSIRVDDMPYGILPVSAWSSWKVGEFDSSEANERELLIKMSKLLQNLGLYWLDLSRDSAKVPHIGATDDPDDELIRILGMQAVSSEYRVRPIVSAQYIWELLRYVWPSLFRLDRIWESIRSLFSSQAESPPGTTVADLSAGSFQSFWQTYLTGRNKALELLKNLLTFNEGAAPQLGSQPRLVNTSAWGSAHLFQGPLVLANPAPENDTVRIPYLLELANGNINSITEPEPLLHWLLKETPSRSELEVDALTYLSSRPVEIVERLTAELLDLSTHRVDAWITSLATRRLKTLREDDEVEGTYLGAYGWVEDLKPDTQKESGGFIHAPSSTHGATAAILRNAYITHANSENNEALSVNLSSTRVNKAQWFLEGIRQGTSLSVLLGYRFERSLHEVHKNGEEMLELDQYISPLRSLYALEDTEHESNNEGSQEIITPRNVVDGRKLLKAHMENDPEPIPFSSGRVHLPNPGTPEHAAICRELDDLAETFDAINDLLLAESVHRAVLGDFEGSGAVMDSISGDGSPPDDLLVAQTPRGGIHINQACFVLLPGDLNSTDFYEYWPSSKRSEASPVINAWAALLLGDPKKMHCTAEYIQDGEIHSVKIDALGIPDPDPEENEYRYSFDLAPVDFVYLSTSALEAEAAGLQAYLAFHIREYAGLDLDEPVYFNFEEHHGDDPGIKSFAELFPMMRSLLELITNCRPLIPQDLFLPEETEFGNDAEGAPDFQGILSAQKMICRSGVQAAKKLIGEAEGLRESLLDNLPADMTGNGNCADEPDISGIDEDSLNSLIVSLKDATEYGLQGTLVGLRGNDSKSILTFLRQACSVYTELDKRITASVYHRDQAKATLDQVDTAIYDPEIQDPPACTLSADLQLDLLSKGADHINATFKGILGKSFVFLAPFSPGNAAELQLTFEKFNSYSNQEVEQLRTWFHDAAQTHPNMGRYELLDMLTMIHTRRQLDDDSWQEPYQTNLKVGQLPYREDVNHWVGHSWAEGIDPLNAGKLQGTVSLVKVCPVETNFTDGQQIAGFVLDVWNEIIPVEEEATSLVYQYDRPSCEAPNVCLLCVAPEVHNGTTPWQWDDIFACLLDTMDLMRIRAVDLDAFRNLGRFLPALYNHVEPVEN